MGLAARCLGKHLRTSARLYGSRAGSTRRFSQIRTERIILGIESSCDDSCAAVVAGPVGERTSGAPSSDQSPYRILSSVVLKQDHSVTHGIYPLAAAVQHNMQIPIAIADALSQAGLGKDDTSALTEIDAIAVTLGPGMASSLSQGVIAAKTLAAVWKKPLIYIHHMVAHTLTPLLTSQDDPPQFPFLTLLVSGGHTMLVLAENVQSYTVLATTQDESIGNSLDKAAKELKIPWGGETGYNSGGAALEAFVESAPTRFVAEEIGLPVPMKGQAQFSYSGLTSSFSTLVASEELSEERRLSLACAFQKQAVAQLEDKISMALGPDRKRHRQSLLSAQPQKLDLRGLQKETIKSVVCSGGVASNKFLRHRLATTLEDIGRSDVKLYFPPIELCTDNAVMIAFAGLLQYHSRTTDMTPTAKQKWSVADLHEIRTAIPVPK